MKATLATPTLCHYTVHSQDLSIGCRLAKCAAFIAMGKTNTPVPIAFANWPQSKMYDGCLVLSYSQIAELMKSDPFGVIQLIGSLMGTQLDSEMVLNAWSKLQDHELLKAPFLDHE